MGRSESPVLDDMGRSERHDYYGRVLLSRECYFFLARDRRVVPAFDLCLIQISYGVDGTYIATIRLFDTTASAK